MQDTNGVERRDINLNWISLLIDYHTVAPVLILRHVHCDLCSLDLTYLYYLKNQRMEEA